MSSQPQKILVVDDEEIIRLATSRILAQEGYHCITVEGASAALEALRDPMDLIISDVRMEGNIELEFFKELRDHFSHIPLIVMTGYPSVPPKIREIPTSMVYCLTKPFDSEALVNAVRGVLGKGKGSEVE